MTPRDHTPDPRARRLLAAAIAMAALAAPSPARADDSAAADALFQQAKALTDAKKYDEACPKFLASYKLDKALGTLLNLADCEEHVDKVASAWAHWGEAVELAGKTGDKREAFAAKHRAELTKQLPMVQLDVVTGKSTLEVYRDGDRIDRAAFGVPLPTDPGEHTISVRRGTAVLERRAVTATKATTANVALDLPTIELAHPPPAPVLVSSAQKPIGAVITGIGGATVLTAGILGILALSNKSTAQAPGGCAGKVCGTDGYDAIGRARTFANATQWVGISGLVVSAVGVTVLLTAPPPRALPAKTGVPSLSVHGWAGGDGAGITLGGAL